MRKPKPDLKEQIEKNHPWQGEGCIQADMNGERKDIHNSEVPVLCQACEARHKGICGVLKPDELLYLSQHSVRKSIETGTELVSDDQDIASYSNILSGVVKLTKMLPDGRQQIVGLQFAPDFLGRLRILGKGLKNGSTSRTRSM